MDLLGSLQFEQTWTRRLLYKTFKVIPDVHNFLLVLLCIVDIVLSSSKKPRRISDDFMGSCDCCSYWNAFYLLNGLHFLD